LTKEQKPIGVIRLNDARAQITNKKNYFGQQIAFLFTILSTESETTKKDKTIKHENRIYYLVAGSAAEADEWIQAINNGSY
jgi:hypothetical protein